MIRLAWNRLIHRKWTSITIIIALLCLFVLTPLGIQQAKKTTLSVQKTIEKYGRGSYDLLVRPAGSRTKIEKTLGMVEENYIGDSQGGISIEEWEELKTNPDIEIAAPVASLGYFRGKQFSIELPVMDEPTKFTWQFFTSDGVEKYPLQDEKSLIYFEQQSLPDTIQIQYIPDPTSTSSGSNMMLVQLPETYHHLVAVDMESEEELTGINLSAYKNEPDSLNLEGIKMNYGDPPVFKVIQRDEIDVPIHMKLKVEALDVELNDYLDELQMQENDWILSSQLAWQFYEKMLEKEAINKTIVDINLSSFIKPFGHMGLKLDNQLKLTESDRYSLLQDTAFYYTSSPIEYHNIEEIPQVNIVEQGNPPAYKEVEQKGVSIFDPDTMEVPFILEPIGAFSPKTAENNLAASPLGIYGKHEVITTDGNTLTPTTIPGSFIPASASGLTDLETARFIKGDKPIDAIRVKVAGIEEYTEEAQKKIDKIAKELLDKGYEVDIVAGSSFKDLTLDVEGIGLVIEPWTTLGVAQELTDTWDAVALLTIGLFIVFSILWLVVRLTFEKNILAHDNDLLSKIGWKQRKVMIRNFLEQFILLTIALVLALAILYQFHATKSMYALVICLWLFSLFVTIIFVMKKQTISNRSHYFKHFAQIWYYKKYIFPTMMILSLSSLLITIQISTLGFTLIETSATSLGAFTVELTFWLQLSILIFTFILATVGLSECFNTLLMERKNEFYMYHVVGWRKSRILKHIAKEVFGWAGMAISFGLIIGGIALSFLYISFVWILIGLTLSCILSVLPIVIIVWTKRVV